MRGRGGHPAPKVREKMCNIEADFMGAHTNTGGGAKLYILNVSCAASCHLTTEIGILTTLAMQSRGHFVVGSGRGGGRGKLFLLCVKRAGDNLSSSRSPGDASKLGARPRAPRPMQTTASHALVRPRAAWGGVAGLNSEDSGTRCHGEMGRSGHCWRPKIETCSTPSRVWTVPYVLRLL